MAAVVYTLVALSVAGVAAAAGERGGEQPLSRIGIHLTTFAIQPGASINTSQLLLGLEWRRSAGTRAAGTASAGGSSFTATAAAVVVEALATAESAARSSARTTTSVAARWTLRSRG
ncbi:hypothetical protein E2562_034602 [Oryza meyeriana var. granulata]|uniref:Uncharacterized protein n=1 Tax=Oryza meyeriana var. granulata TaxID=110450 RepID=A0A6G1DQW6_9ORYZ|nr:hypothetical protein E2562_034602 [Oryza meyeriana var. granulata]